MTARTATDVRLCSFCEDGCEECGGTAQRVTSVIEVEGTPVIVHGNTPLSEASAKAVGAIIQAALDLLAEGAR
jgi:hypothetical protein